MNFHNTEWRKDNNVPNNEKNPIKALCHVNNLQGISSKIQRCYGKGA